jgi:hypothetical protein
VWPQGKAVNQREARAGKSRSVGWKNLVDECFHPRHPEDFKVRLYSGW